MLVVILMFKYVRNLSFPFKCYNAVSRSLDVICFPEAHYDNDSPNISLVLSQSVKWKCF